MVQMVFVYEAMLIHRSGRLGFPALEKLTLDFTEWQLQDSEGLLVSL